MFQVSKLFLKKSWFSIFSNFWAIYLSIHDESFFNVFLFGKIFLSLYFFPTICGKSSGFWLKKFLSGFQKVPFICRVDCFGWANSAEKNVFHFFPFWEFFQPRSEASEGVLRKAICVSKGYVLRISSMKLLRFLLFFVLQLIFLNFGRFVFDRAVRTEFYLPRAKFWRKVFVVLLKIIAYVGDNLGVLGKSVHLFCQHCILRIQVIKFRERRFDGV